MLISHPGVAEKSRKGQWKLRTRVCSFHCFSSFRVKIISWHLIREVNRATSVTEGRDASAGSDWQCVGMAGLLARFGVLGAVLPSKHIAH